LTKDYSIFNFKCLYHSWDF